MATFPALMPGDRTWTPGTAPHTAHRTHGGREVRVRHSNASIGGRLRLTFYLLTRAEKLSLRDHYGGQLGGFLAFDIPAALLIGVAAPGTIDRLGYRWRYAGSPKVADIPIDDDSGPLNRHNISIELAHVPPEAVTMPGARLTCAPALEGGAAVSPAALVALVTMAGGEFVGAVYAAAVSLEGGEPARPTAFAVAVSLEGGKPARPTVFAVAVSLEGGEPARPALFTVAPVLAGGGAV